MSAGVIILEELEFARRRGYDLRRQLPALAGPPTDEAAQRVRADYRQTIADLVDGAP